MAQVIEYRLVNLADVIAATDPNQPVAFDTETVGFYSKIRLAQFYQPHWDGPLMVENPNPFELVAFLNAQPFYCHNVHYDITCIQENTGKNAWIPQNFDCTFLLARLHFFLKESFSLDDVVRYVLGYNPYEDNDQQKSDWGVPVLSEEQLVYAASDVVYLSQVYDAVKASRDDFSYKLDLLTTRYCLEFQNNGMPVDVSRIDAKYLENMKRIKEIALPINCNSYQQVRKYIDSNKSDDLGLAELAAKDHERAKAVRETRKLVKSNSFLTKFKDTMEDLGNGFGVIYGKFKCSARSGRTTSDDQNLQQLPRSLKSMFGVEEHGEEVILFSDFAQIQLRAVCVKTGDRTMERLFRAGEDLHNFVAKMIFGEDFTKEQRQICKTANFGLLFGAGAVVFIAILLKQAGLWLTEAEANAFKKKWLALWTQIAGWQTQGIKDWKKKLPWETPLGRRYTAKMMTDQLAMQIQGFEAEVAKLAMHYMWPKLKELSAQIKLRDFIHDSYIFTAPNDPVIYEKACVIIADAMQEAWKEMCQNLIIPDLPMPVKVRVGWNWGDIEKDVFIMEHAQ